MKFKTSLIVLALLSLPVIASAQTTDTTPPTTPGGFLAVPTFNTTSNIAGYDGVQLSWNASSDNGGVLGYKLKRVLTSNLASSSQDLPDAAIIADISGTSFWDASAAGHTQYTYSVVAYDADGNASTASRVTILTPYGKGARIKTMADSSVYNFNTKSGKLQKNGKDTQLKGALGTELSGPMTVEANNPKNTVTYYQVDFDNGPDGYIDAANLIGAELASVQNPRLAIESMQTILANLETRLRAILAKIEELRTALTAAAAASQ